MTIHLENDFPQGKIICKPMNMPWKATIQNSSAITGTQKINETFCCELQMNLHFACLWILIRAK